MIEWTHQKRECYFCDFNFYPFLSTAGLVLAGALSPPVHGCSHGLASFSGYPLPHVDPQNHSFPDIHTHHHNTSSTIFTPAGSWKSDLYLPSGSGLSAVTQDKTELEFLSVDEVMKVDSPGSARMGGSGIPVYPKKVRQNTQNSSKYTQVYFQVYFIPEI